MAARPRPLPPSAYANCHDLGSWLSSEMAHVERHHCCQFLRLDTSLLITFQRFSRITSQTVELMVGLYSLRYGTQQDKKITNVCGLSPTPGHTSFLSVSAWTVPIVSKTSATSGSTKPENNAPMFQSYLSD